MMKDDFGVHELQRLKLTPLNRAASIKLREAGVAERDNILPVFLLMEWGLSAGIRLTHRRTSRELIRLSLRVDRKEALDYLLYNVPGGVKDLTRRLLRLTPRAAAQELLDILDMRLKADPGNNYPEPGGN